MNNPASSVVLIPGFMLDETLWDEFRGYLPENWVVIHAVLTGGSNIRDIAKHIADRLPERVVLIGFSLGGYIARQLAADYPEKVQALVIIASSLRDDTEQQVKSKLHAVQALSPSTFRGLSADSIAKSLHPCRSSNTSLISRIQHMGRRLDYDALALQSSLRRADVSADRIGCPTLVVASTHDALRTIEEADELVRAISDASLQLFDGSGHMIPLEQPQKLAATIASWLGTQGLC